MVPLPTVMAPLVIVETTLPPKRRPPLLSVRVLAPRSKVLAVLNNKALMVLLLVKVTLFVILLTESVESQVLGLVLVVLVPERLPHEPRKLVPPILV